MRKERKMMRKTMEKRRDFDIKQWKKMGKQWKRWKEQGEGKMMPSVMKGKMMSSKIMEKQGTKGTMTSTWSDGKAMEKLRD